MPEIVLCNARLKCDSEHRCKRPVCIGRKRCNLHGGLSTGPRTKEGVQRTIEGRNRWLAKLRAEGRKLPGRTKGARNRAILDYEQAVLDYPAALARHEQERRAFAVYVYEREMARLKNVNAWPESKESYACAEAHRAYDHYPAPPAPPRREDFKSPARYQRKPAWRYQSAPVVEAAPAPAPPSPPVPQQAPVQAQQPVPYGRGGVVTDKGLDWLTSGW
jgi:hypothetical protein